MKRSRLLTFTFSSLYSLSAGYAQTAPVAAAPSSPSSIVTLNFNAAVLSTAEAQRSPSALQKKYLPREQELQKLNDAIEALKKTLSEGATKLSEVDRSQKLQELAARDKQLQREAEDYKNDSQAESQQAFQQVAQKVFSFLQEYSQQHGYAAVLERGTDAAPVVWYAASSVDITEQLTRSYDAKFGGILPDSPAATGSAPGNGVKKP